jgi:hypothetical protein
MITSTVKIFDRFAEITDQVERAAVEGLDAAAREAASVAQANASIPLELEVKPAVGDVEGYSAGIKSRKKTRNQGRTTPIAHFFDEGTLGKRKKPPKRGRKGSWTVRQADGGSHTASRGDIDGRGIEPEHFFAKGRSAGRKKLLERIQQQL